MWKTYFAYFGAQAYFIRFSCSSFGKDLAFILGDKFSDHFITACLDEIDAARKGKIYFKDFLQLFHEDYSQSTGEWLHEQGFDYGYIENH